ncbi:MAG: hypothetical protein RIT26_1998 [Pseudomonadota bacterium]
MSSSISSTDSIEGSGHPLCFKTLQGSARPGVLGLNDAQDLFITQARAMGGHQKEAVVLEGEHGSAWRMVSDEGPALQGTDLAPFPLGFMSAALQAELLQRMALLARQEGVVLGDLRSLGFNDYVFEGSFFRGTGRGQALPPRFTLQARTSAPAEAVRNLARRAALSSPLLAAWATPLQNTFALYANGRRVQLRELRPSQMDARDPFKVWAQLPTPLAGDQSWPDIVSKAPPVPVKNPTQASGWETGRVDIPIHGQCAIEGGRGRSLTWANRLGGSAFAIVSDDRADGDQAPSALAHAFAGIAFCFMTQLLRYVAHHEMKVRALRLVQYSPCRIESGLAQAMPLDTHVFVHTEESDEVMERLVQMSARTCYLHAALGATLAPEIGLDLGALRAWR